MFPWIQNLTVWELKVVPSGHLANHNFIQKKLSFLKFPLQLLLLYFIYFRSPDNNGIEFKDSHTTNKCEVYTDL